MSANIPDIFGQQFASTIQMLVQQKQSRLREAVTLGSYRGSKAQSVDQVGAIAMQPVVSRFGPMGRVDAQFDSRWVAPSDFELPQLIDSFDKLKLLLDPTSIYYSNALAAANRQIDDLLIAAFTASALTGVDGTTATPILAANTVAVTVGSSPANSGMNVAKLRAGKKILRKNEVDLDTDPLYMAITAEEEEDLLSEAQVISTDFNDKPVLVDGKLMRFYGVNFIHSERLAFSSGVIRSCPMWAKSGMHLGIWEDIVSKVSQRDDLSGLPYQIYIKMSMGATRIEEKKIVRVLCDET